MREVAIGFCPSHPLCLLSILRLLSLYLRQRYLSITPLPTSTSPLYHAANWPAVMPR